MITTYGATEEAGQSPAPPQPKSGLSPEQIQALERLIAKRDQLDPDRRAMVEITAKNNGIALPPMQGFSTKPNPGKDAIETIAQTAKVSAFPMAGQLLGGVASQVASPGNIPLSMVMQGVGAAGGTKLNEVLGISKPDEMDYLLSAGAPLVGGVIGTKGRRLIPGAAAAEQQMAAEELKKMPGMLSGDKASTRAAYQKVEGVSNQLPVENFKQTVQELAATEATAKKYGVSSPQIRKMASETAKELANNPTGMPFDEAALLLKRYREKVSGLETKGGENYGAYKALRKSLFADMDAAVTRAETEAGLNVTDRSLAQAATDLKAAMAASKQQITKDEFTDILGRYGTKMVTVGNQTFEVIEPTNVLNKLRQSGFEDAVGKDQFKKIADTLKELAKVPKPSLDIKTGIGSEGRAIAVTGGGILGATAGAAFGVPMQGGAATALATYGAIKAHDAVAQMMMSDKGREALIWMFKRNKGKIGAQTGEALQYLASQIQETPE